MDLEINYRWNVRWNNEQFVSSRIDTYFFSIRKCTFLSFFGILLTRRENNSWREDNVELATGTRDARRHRHK